MIYRFSIALLLLSWVSIGLAATYPLPKAGNDIIGHVFTIETHPGDNFDTIARRYDVGYFELMEANPQYQPYDVPAHAKVIIPAEYVLPKTRHGIVLNIAELRLYYFPPNKKIVETFPVGIGQIGERTPTGNYHIIQKIKNPKWRAPESVRKVYQARGITIPPVVPSGPANPLGYYAMRLNTWSYLIHGTNMPYSVGKRTSAGCVHLYPKDIKFLFPQVAVNTRVHIINDYYKIGWQNNKLYLEVEKPLSEQQKQANANLTPLVNLINNTIGNQHVTVNWEKATKLAVREDGIPTVIGQRVNGTKPHTLSPSKHR